MAKQKLQAMWFKMPVCYAALICSMSDAAVGRALKAVMRYFETGETAGLKGMEHALYQALRPYVDKSFSDYQTRAECGRKGGFKKASNAKLSQNSAAEYKDNKEDKENKENKEDREDKENKEQICDADKPPHTKRFISPSINDVQAYCREKDFGMDAQRFVDYYTANGWRVGKNPMKDWKAAVRCWEKKEQEYGNGTTQRTDPDRVYSIGTVL